MTMQVTVLTVAASVLIAYPAAFIIAKRNFAGKKLIMGLFLLPVIIPPISYGLPLATIIYRSGLATTVPGVVIANMVPTVSFMILVIMPFIEQIGDNVESAARMLGASKIQYFVKILIPLTIPGVVSAVVLSVVRVISMFELTFLVSGAKTQTIIVTLFADVNAPGFRPNQMIDALAMIFFVLTVVLSALSMKYGSPTSVYSRIGQSEK
jgi:putative spermidine/putrescine transport system permease protein